MILLLLLYFVYTKHAKIIWLLFIKFITVYLVPFHLKHRIYQILKQKIFSV